MGVNLLRLYLRHPPRPEDTTTKPASPLTDDDDARGRGGAWGTGDELRGGVRVEAIQRDYLGTGDMDKGR